MKIDDSLSGVPSIRSKKARDKRKSDSSAGTASLNGNDSVEFTEASSQLSKLENALGNVGTTDAGKIDAVRQAIADGQFNVDEEAVADALVQNSLDQMKRQGRK